MTKYEEYVKHVTNASKSTVMGHVFSFPTHTLKLPLKLQKKIQYSYRNVPETMTNRQQRRRHVIHGSLCVKPSCKKPRRAETIHLSIERISFFKIAH